MSKGNWLSFIYLFTEFGITEPEESRTLPNLTIENFVIWLNFFSA